MNIVNFIWQFSDRLTGRRALQCSTGICSFVEVCYFDNDYIDSNPTPKHLAAVYSAATIACG